MDLWCKDLKKNVFIALVLFIVLIKNDYFSKYKHLVFNRIFSKKSKKRFYHTALVYVS